MAQVGNLKRFIRNIDRTSGGLVAPPSGDFHLFATTLFNGATDFEPQPSMDTITLAGGPEWIRPAEDFGGVTLLRSGVYTFQPLSLFFQAGATPFTENQTLQAGLFYTNRPLIGVYQFCSSDHKVTAEEVDDGVALAYYQGFASPSQTFFLPKGAVIELHRLAGPNDVSIGMELYVHPVAFAG